MSPAGTYEFQQSVISPVPLGNEFLEPIQIQPSSHQLVADDEAGSSRDAEFMGEGRILGNDGCHLKVTDTPMQLFYSFNINSRER